METGYVRADRRKELAKLSQEKLLDYINVTSKNFFNLQNNWMLRINEKYGMDVALEFDDLVFGRNSEVQMWRMKKLFNLKDDISSLEYALIISQVAGDIDFDIWQVSDKILRLRVPVCPQQMERRKLGLPELPCKPAGIGCFQKMARAINPKIELKCLICPPDPHPDDLWCEWEWELRE